MSDLTLEPDFAEHPKVGELSDAAFRAHVRGLCWCAKYETDGYVSARMAAQFAQGELLDELVRWRLWERDGDSGGARIRDYLEYNPSREELARERARPRRAGAAKAPRPRRATQRPHTSEDQIKISVTDQIPDPAQQPEGLGSGRPRRWRRVPTEWAHNWQHEELARKLGVDLATELESFRDHEFRDPKTDADAAFRTWLRNAKRFTPRNQPKESLQERAKRLALEQSNLRVVGGKP